MGAGVPVLYDPGDPERTTLHATPSRGKPIAGIVIGALLAIVMDGLLLKVFVEQRAGSRARRTDPVRSKDLTAP